MISGVFEILAHNSFIQRTEVPQNTLTMETIITSIVMAFLINLNGSLGFQPAEDCEDREGFDIELAVGAPSGLDADHQTTTSPTERALADSAVEPLNQPTTTQLTPNSQYVAEKLQKNEETSMSQSILNKAASVFHASNLGNVIFYVLLILSILSYVFLAFIFE